MSFGDNIKSLRLKKGMTQAQFGEYLGKFGETSKKTATHIARYEKNLSYPRVELLIDIARDFDVSIDWLLDYNISIEKTMLQEVNHLLLPKFQLMTYNDFKYSSIGMWEANVLTKDECNDIRNDDFLIVALEEIPELHMTSGSFKNLGSNYCIYYILNKVEKTSDILEKQIAYNTVSDIIDFYNDLSENKINQEQLAKAFNNVNDEDYDVELYKIIDGYKYTRKSAISKFLSSFKNKFSS